MAQPRILVVDDDRLMLTLLVGVLRQEGFNLVTKASSGAEALEKCKAEAPDIVFLDIEMPGMNGLETFEALQKEGIASQVILVSASPKTNYVIAAKNHQAAGFIVKPASPKVISDAIAKCLKHIEPPDLAPET